MTDKPYVVFFTFDDYALKTMKPVYDLFEADPNFDSTLLLAAHNIVSIQQDPHVRQEVRYGLQGRSFDLRTIKVARRPDVLIGFRLWWGPDHLVAVKAYQLRIPMVMINHGAMFVRNDAQTYKRNLGGARINCLWGKFDRDLWRYWNPNDKMFEVTGNPLHDNLVNYKCPNIDVPEEFALLLTPRDRRKFLHPSAEALSKIMPVIAKTHPIDKEKGYYKERYITFDDPDMLLPLMFKAKLILANVTSAFIPALLWQKPIFVHTFGNKGYHFGEFKEKTKHIFNFKQDAIWNENVIDKAIIPTVDDYKLFGHEPDGNNAKRVAEVIKRYV
jgi:hypothetical protein